MIFYKTLSWETALDVAGILIGCFIIIYLLYNKIKYRRLLIDARSTERGTAPQADITHQMVKQQVERILYLVSGTVANELMVLKEMTAAEGIMRYQTRTPTTGIGPGQRSDTQSDLLGPPSVGFEPDPYVEVGQMSQDGLSPQQIAEKVKLPLAEIELLLKLNLVG